MPATKPLKVELFVVCVFLRVAYFVCANDNLQSVVDVSGFSVYKKHYHQMALSDRAD